ncbi:hypothetical protein GS501_09650 [Saccharibacter sp. 17.LH.SD]|uniref:sulfurtransferase TusA family protein n=1 Tax=Saccharibacter sp. 17.LH.SD TaxID=2689393 RepID=UPI00136DD3A3|nr:sulfurtransferase TusA family protein [Saccharibacter sp. 17.LH.SD]MXV45294.1 hypothetical protein [Saccharibacter sp. 17.LH.SD]
MTEEICHLLDVRHFLCPMSSVQVRLHIDQLPVGAVSKIQLHGLEALENITTLLNTLQHSVLIQNPHPTLGGVYFIIFRKN